MIAHVSAIVPPLADAPLLAAALAGGLALGAGYFAVLHRAVRAHAEGGSVIRFAALLLVRIAAAAAGFVLAARWGAASLITALGGFLAARAIAMHALRRAA